FAWLGKTLKEHSPDLVVLARYMRILPAQIVAAFKSRIINIHPSLLPYFPGAAPYKQAYESGVRVHGCTAHFVTEQLDAEQVFRHPRINVWRSIPDRENCTLDAELEGQPIRLHIKRYHPAMSFTTPADDEVRAIRALEVEQIPTVPLVGWGKLPDRRS